MSEPCVRVARVRGATDRSTRAGFPLALEAVAEPRCVDGFGVVAATGVADAGQTPSTTTITFARATPPAGWGFAFGDIDADQIQIAATGPTGTLTATELGFQGVFNYCTATTPRPATCGGAAQTDVPTWDPATSTLVGNGVDTSGASGWFRPTVPVTAITLTFSRLIGIPSFQMWASAITSNVSGAVTLDNTGDPAPAGTTVRLLDADGIEVATTTTSDTGAYSFVDVIATDYSVAVVAPAGYEVRGAGELDAAAGGGDVSGVDFFVGQIPPSTTSPPTSPSTTVPTTTTPGGAIAPTIVSSTTTFEPSGQLPATGASSPVIVLVGLLAATAGVALIGAARRPGVSSRREM